MNVDLLIFLPSRSLWSMSPLLCLPVCFQESGSSCLHSLICSFPIWDLRLSLFSSLPCGFQNPSSWILFLAYERLRPLAPLEEPKPKPDASLCPNCFFLLMMTQMIRYLGLPMDLGSDLGSPTDPLCDPLLACLGSLICKMDIMTNKERRKSNQVFIRLSRHHSPSQEKG